MIKKILIGSSLVILLLSGCSNSGTPEYDGRSYQQIKTIQKGIVIVRNDIVIADTGTGQSVGGMVGSVAGSAAGYNSGNWLASLTGALVGGLAGSAVGSELGKSDGSELTVDLENGETIIIVVKQNDIEVGDKIEIIKSGAKVERVNIVD